ncbi:hypothetical protein IAU59_003882 [Kwoniella sp. CBS 9459]
MSANRASTIKPQSSSAASRLPLEVLSLILDAFVDFDFLSLKTATRIDIASYRRYYQRLYRHAKFDQSNVDVLHNLIYRPYTGREDDFYDDYLSEDSCSDSESGVVSAIPDDLHARARSRIRSVCRSIVYLTLVDEHAGKTLALKTKSHAYSSHGMLFPNLEFLTLKNGFMRYLESFDYRERYLPMDSKRMVKQIGGAMRPKHLCIESLRVRERKDSKSPEIWKIGLLKQDWGLETITFHREMWDIRTLFSGISLHRFFVYDYDDGSVLRVVDEGDWKAEGFQVEIISKHWHYIETSILPPEIEEKMTVKSVVKGDAGAYPCVCCGSKACT